MYGDSGPETVPSRLLVVGRPRVDLQKFSSCARGDDVVQHILFIESLIKPDMGICF
jgi:hypothetical protein